MSAHRTSRGDGPDRPDGLDLRQFRPRGRGKGRCRRRCWPPGRRPTLERKQLPELVKRLNLDLEDTPVPDSEWRAVIAVLGAEEVSALVGVSMSSARRYQSGERETPDVVAARLHFLALVIADLLGAYNSYGVRRWFDRVRSTLDGQSPKSLLGGDWDPTDKDAGKVAEVGGQPGNDGRHVIGYRHCDPRYPFLWEDDAQPAARWHGPQEGPVNYLADTPDGAWASFSDMRRSPTPSTSPAYVDQSGWSISAIFKTIQTPTWRRG